MSDGLGKKKSTIQIFVHSSGNLPFCSLKNAPCVLCSAQEKCTKMWPLVYTWISVAALVRVVGGK